MNGLIVDVVKSVGDHVDKGDPIAVLSAMKMETAVTAPCSGTVAALRPLSVGDAVDAGLELVAIAPAEGAARPERAEGGAWSDVLDQVAALRKLALARMAPGSQDR